MKKILLLISLATFALGASAKGGDFQLGVKTGFNSTHFTTTNYNVTGLTVNNVKEDAKSGYCLGVYARLPLFSRLRFQPELYYNSKNGSSDVTINNVVKPSNIEIKSWDIPLLFNLKLIDLKVIEIYALAGPAISFLSNPATTNFNENYKTAGWNFQGGLGAQIWKINIDTRYEWGLSNISKGSSTSPDISRKSNSFQINLSFNFL